MISFPEMIPHISMKFHLISTFIENSLSDNFLLYHVTLLQHRFRTNYTRSPQSVPRRSAFSLVLSLPVGLIYDTTNVLLSFLQHRIFCLLPLEPSWAYTCNLFFASPTHRMADAMDPTHTHTRALSVSLQLISIFSPIVDYRMQCAAIECTCCSVVF